MKVQHAVGNAAAIRALQLTPGKIYFAQDEKKIFFDTQEQRIEINAEIATAVATLMGDANVAGSVANIANAAAAREVARIVGGADSNLDTLEEIAAWITSDEGGNAAAGLNQRLTAVENAVENTVATKSYVDNNFALQNQIPSLEGYVQTSTLNTTLANYALAANVPSIAGLALQSDLEALAARVLALENAGNNQPEPEPEGE